MSLRIRRRLMYRASPRQGLKSSWIEYQVLDGLRVISRHDLLSQARRWCDENRQGEEVREIGL
jgi:hypothetical protein